jgi:hypothetical protein
MSTGISDLDRKLAVARVVAQNGEYDGTTVPLLEFAKSLRDGQWTLLAKAVEHVGKRPFLEAARHEAFALERGLRSQIWSQSSW